MTEIQFKRNEVNRSIILKVFIVVFTAISSFQDSTSQTVGNYSSHTVSGNNIVFKCSSGATVKIEMCKPDMVRIRMAVQGTDFVPNEPYSVVKYEWPSVGAKVSDAGEYIKITTTAMIIRANKNPFKLDFYESDNKTLITRQHITNGMGWNGTTKTMTFDRDAGGKTEHFYGGGMHYRYFDLRGLNIKIYQRDPQAARGPVDGSAITVVPYYWSSGGYGMLLHNSFPSYFDFGKADSSAIGWNVTDGELDFYFLKGSSFKKIIQSYCDLTGYLEMPPKKALGLTYRAQGNNGYLLPKPVYLGAKDIDSITTGFRSRGVPCDIIATEPGWAPGYGNVVWDQSKFPDPEGWSKRMINNGFMPNLWMQFGIKDQELKTLLDKYIVKRGLFDPTIKEGMDAYFGWLKTHHFDFGIAGFKEDTHGITDTTGTLKSGLSLKEYHNSYSYIWGQGLFNRYKETYNKRFLLYITALWTGAQRYPMVCYSDQGVQITWISNSGWTGMAYTPELQKWSGAKSYTDLHSIAFTPYMCQNEWIYGNLPWSSDQDSYNVYLKYVRLHYKLIPYIYSQMWEQHNTGIGPIRPLPLEFQDDPKTYSISNQYFYGKNLMVSFDHSKIYLPKGKWTYYWDGRTFDGGKTLSNFNAPADELPLFVRAGAIIPMMPDMNYVGEKPIDPLIIDVYPEGTSGFTLYEDDGISFNYEKGDYSETAYKVVRNIDNIVIDINARKTPGSYTPPSRNYLFMIHNGTDPLAVFKDDKIITRKGTESELSTSVDGWYYSNGITRVRFYDTGKAILISLGRKK